MASTAKGEETKQRIITNARFLFYEQGYSETSLRQISEKTGTNIGLMNYYFENKAGIAMLIYSDIRSSFDILLKKYEPTLSREEFFILSSAIELYLALECKAFGNFYFTLSSEPVFHNNIGKIIMTIVDRHSDLYADKNLAKLNCLGIMAIKPALVSRFNTEGFDIPHRTVVEYYMKMQLQMLGIDAEKSSYYLQIMEKYYYNLAPGFTPVMTPLYSPNSFASLSSDSNSSEAGSSS